MILKTLITDNTTNALEELFMQEVPNLVIFIGDKDTIPRPFFASTLVKVVEVDNMTSPWALVNEMAQKISENSKGDDEVIILLGNTEYSSALQMAAIQCKMTHVHVSILNQLHIMPIFSKEELHANQKKILEILKDGREYVSSQLAEKLPIRRRMTQRHLTQLKERGLVEYVPEEHTFRISPAGSLLLI